jgi:riboflavin-specific deaminase-like protein
MQKQDYLYLESLILKPIRFHLTLQKSVVSYMILNEKKETFYVASLQDVLARPKGTYRLFATRIDDLTLNIPSLLTLGVVEIITANLDTPSQIIEGLLVTSYDVISALDKAPAEDWIQQKQTPWITLSYGMSMDGKIATHTGDSKYITGPEARQVVHQLRHTHDAILIGINTVQMDHPLLTTRLDSFQGENPIKIILDSHLQIDLEEGLLSQGTPTILVCKADAPADKVNRLRQRGVNVLIDSSISKGIDLPWLLTSLFALGIHSILVEGGGTIHFSFIQNRLFNRIYAQISPLLIGGKDAKTPVEGEGFSSLKNAIYVAYSKYWQIGHDILLKAEQK